MRRDKCYKTTPKAVRLGSGTSSSHPVHRSKNGLALSPEADAQLLPPVCPWVASRLSVVEQYRRGASFERDEINHRWIQCVVLRFTFSLSTETVFVWFLKIYVRSNQILIWLYLRVRLSLGQFHTLQMHASKYSYKWDCHCTFYTRQRGVFLFSTVSLELFHLPVKEALDEDQRAEASGGASEGRNKSSVETVELHKKKLVCLVEKDNQDLSITLQTQWAIMDSYKRLYKPHKMRRLD